MNFIQKLKSVFNPLPVTIALIVIFVIGNSFSVIQAQPADTGNGALDGQEDTDQEQENVVCQIEMGKFLDTEFKKYLDFMDTNFQNKSSTGSLLDLGFDRYREFRNTVMKEYSKYSPQQSASQLTEGLEPGACMEVVENKLNDARRTLKNVAAQTSAVKETTALITKYQDINNQLRVLNQSFLAMKSYLTTFSDKLPCYVKKGCTKS